jgi:plasmid stabilization system protein ParE
MAADLILTPEANADLDEAYAWYEAQQVGRGEDFLTRVDACLRSVTRLPEMYAPFHGTYRRALVRRYPFAVFYEHHEGIVTVYSVFHTSQNPDRWRDRLPG